MVMELWCDTMLTFISRFIHVTQQKHQDEQRQFLTVSSQLEQSPLPSASPHSSTSSHKQELMETMIASGFVRWIMQQLGRVFIFVHEQECSARSSGHFDEPHLRTRPPSPLGRFATAIRTIRDRQVVLESSKQSAPLSQKGRNAALRLQDVCVSSHLFRIYHAFFVTDAAVVSNDKGNDEQVIETTLIQIFSVS